MKLEFFRNSSAASTGREHSVYTRPSLFCRVESRFFEPPWSFTGYSTPEDGISTLVMHPKTPEMVAVLLVANDTPPPCLPPSSRSSHGLNGLEAGHDGRNGEGLVIQTVPQARRKRPIGDGPIRAEKSVRRPARTARGRQLRRRLRRAPEPLVPRSLPPQTGERARLRVILPAHLHEQNTLSRQAEFGSALPPGVRSNPATGTFASSAEIGCAYSRRAVP